MADTYEQYVAKMQKIADLHNAAAVLNWDEETYLPVKGAAFRGQQLATLSTLAHDHFADPELGHLLQELLARDDLSPLQHQNVSRSWKDYEKNQKYPSAFVHQLSLTTSRCYQAWMNARQQNDFRPYTAALEEMVALKQEEAALLGYDHHRYDALLDDYEQGASVAMLDEVFRQAITALQPLIDQIMAEPAGDYPFLSKRVPREQQWTFGIAVLRTMGFDFAAGRQDVSEHPFTTSFNPRDVRLTTRIDENDFANMTWSCIHEGGHGLYEQGLPEAQYGLPGGEAASLSIHESQSRLWENNVGRARPFWNHFYPQLQTAFGLENIDLDTFYKAINRVGLTPIRTESDELTYHLHIFIRYQLEKQLIEGSLAVADLREAWNGLYEKHLHLVPADDRQGVLQDIHWSHGSFGYFPTYSLGSFYAAQFYRAAQQALPGLEQQLAGGHFADLLDWLRKHIHRHGRLYPSAELCEKVTGEALRLDYFLDYVQKKYRSLYGLTAT